MKRSMIGCTVVTFMAVTSGALWSGESVAEIVAKMPAKDAAEGQELLAQAAKLGAPAVKEICGMIKPPGQGDDGKARFALHGMILHAKRPGADAERTTIANVLLEAMASAADKDLKTFFILEFKWIGSEEAVAPLGKLLADDSFCEPAAQALQEIATPSALEQFRQALPAAKGKNQATMVRALGVFRDKQSAAAIRPHIGAADVDLRRVAMFAAANIGDAAATDALVKAADATTPYERSLGTEALLLLARRLAEDGKKDECAKICRDLLKNKAGPEYGNVQCAAYHVLAQAQGEAVLDDLLAAVEGPNMYVREAVLNIVQAMPGQAVTDKVIQKAKAAQPPVQAAIIAMLGRRGDKSAEATVIETLKSKEEIVRVAAMNALARLNPKQAALELTALLAAAQPNEAAPIKSVLMTIRDEGFPAAVAAALAKAKGPGRVALLELLGARAATEQAAAIFEAAADPDDAVRAAAIRALTSTAAPADMPRVVKLLLAGTKPDERKAAADVAIGLCRQAPDSVQGVLDALGKAEGESRATLLQALARIGGPKALAAVLADTKSATEPVQDAAIRALASWEDPAAAPELLKLAREAVKEPHKVLALRGYIRLAGLPNVRPVAETVAMFQSALEAAKSPAEKKAVLGGLGAVRDVGALKLAGTCLDDAALAEEAAMAAVRIACPTDNKDKGLRGAAVAEVLGKVVAVSKNAGVVEKAKKQLEAAKK